MTTTLPRPNLKREIGVTKISLENGDRLLRAYGLPSRVVLDAGGDSSECRVLARWDNGAMFVFTGFSWSYGGEGPRGLRKWCEANEVPLRMAEIVKLDARGYGEVWSFDRSTGKVSTKSETRPQGMEF